MSSFSQEFSNKDYQLVANQESVINLREETINKEGTYVRIIVYTGPDKSNIVRLRSADNDGNLAVFYGTTANLLNVNTSPFETRLDQIVEKTIGTNINPNTELPYNDFKIYVNNPGGHYQEDDNNFYVKPNEIFNDFGLPGGDFTIEIDFLNQVRITKPLDYFVNFFPAPDEDSLLQQISELPFPQHIEEFLSPVPGDVILSAQMWVDTYGRPDISSYMVESSADGSFATLPSEPSPHYQFLIKQISTSRREVRLKLKDRNISSLDSSGAKIISNLKNEFNNFESEFLEDTDANSPTYGDFVIPNPNYKYQFKHVLNVGNGNHIPIMNYEFDRITNGKDNQSIILKLYEPLLPSVQNLSFVSIEKEVLTSQVEDIQYISDVPPLFFGDGLLKDNESNWIDLIGDQDGYQNYNQLSASISNISLDHIISSSENRYPNLNTNYNDFANHTFFGSAKKKLENFKTKIETIQGYYSQISTSLSISSSMLGDGDVVVNERKTLFKKIDDEINSFTPYERFLYFDGQSESTASAPGIGKNYASTIPVNTGNDYNQSPECDIQGLKVPNHYQGSIDNLNGLPIIHKFSSNNFTGHITQGNVYDGIMNQQIYLFNNTTQVHKKPFFNYSSSVYLSFLMKADSGSRLEFDDREGNMAPALENNGFRTPQKTLYSQSLSEPQMTGSVYQRYIFHASRSYYIPRIDDNATLNDDGVQIQDLQHLDNFWYSTGLQDIQLLSGSKKGTYQIADSTGTYPVTAITESGAPFFGSVMPSGELFRIQTKNQVSKSLIAYWNIDEQTSGSAITNDMLGDDAGSSNNPNFTTNISPTHPKFNTGSIEGSPTISDGVHIHGRSYGKSFYFLSESADSVRFFEGSAGGAQHPDSPSAAGSSGLNFHKHNDFSLSVWAKRFHPNVANADPSTPASGSGTPTNVQGIFMRGHTGPSYGIDYYFTGSNQQVRAGVRSTVAGTSHTATFNTTDDLLEWNHLVFTYESGSSTGIKLYVNGDLKDSESTLHSDGFNITGSLDFSASKTPGDVDYIGTTNEALNIGGNDVGGGSGNHFNGFIQYPRVYRRALKPEDVQQLYLTPDGHTQYHITDVKLSLYDPTNVQPFSQLYHTSSAEWTSWYDGLIDSASVFDTDNIHSFENNLPLYIQNSSEYNDMKSFLNLQGEQYDLIKNHIDSFATIHDRGYSELDSPPNNILPMLLSNMGWGAINPFSGSLQDTLAPFLTSITSIDDIKNQTWRKTLNNLIYIYKSKGTENSIRGLLNVYGYPPDVLKLQEFGGLNENPVDGPNNNILSDWYTPPDSVDGTLTPTSTTSTNDLDLNIQTGSISFNSNLNKLMNYSFLGQNDAILNLDWWMDNANINTIQFVYKHRKTTNEQIILESSGSGTEKLWDLRLVPSSDGQSSSFEFRLNNTNTGSGNITNNALSMSTVYSSITNGQLWNVMLQRMSSSISGSGINEYRLHASFQDDKKIKTYNYVTMSVSGGLTNDYITGSDVMTGSVHGRGYFANQNWILSGSRHTDSSSNLIVGRTLTGSLSEIRAWDTALSVSRFRQHTINKFSTVGNTIDSHRKELRYHFKLNENYTTSSISASINNDGVITTEATKTFTIIDSAPKTTYTTDYSFEQTSSVFTGSRYTKDFINVVNITSTTTQNSKKSNSVLIKPKLNVVGDLSPHSSAVESLVKPISGKKPKLITSTRLELYRSPQTFVDDFILNNVGSFSLEPYFGNPIGYYSSSYEELDKFRKDFFDAHPIEVNMNKFIRAHENMFNESILSGIKQLVPARSTFSGRRSNVGVEIRPTILEKQKYENEHHSVEVNPNTSTGSIGIISIKEHLGNDVIRKTTGVDISNSTFESIKEGNVSIQSIKENIKSGSDGQFDTENFRDITGLTFTGSSIVLPHSTSISMGSNYVTESRDGLNSMNIGKKYTVPNFLQFGGYSSSIDYPITSSLNFISVKENIKSGSEGQFFTENFRDTVGISFSGSGVVFPKSGTLDYASDANKSFVNIHDNWGTGTDDIHFINYEAGTGSRGDYNVRHIDTRFHFLSIGDTEIYSGSRRVDRGSFDNTDFSNSDKFFNRTIIKTDIHKNIVYESLINGDPGKQVGRMMGKTRYFITSSDGNIILPANHITKFSQPFKEQMINGTQNVNPGFLNVQYEDYSSASFYRVKVTGGENEIIVRGNGPSDIDSEDRIIY